MPGCRGNRLLFDAAGAVRGFSIPHHKTAHSAGTITLDVLPAELVELLGVFLSEYRAVLLRGAEPGWLFVDGRGRQLLEGTFSGYWKSSVLPTLGLQGEAFFAPVRARHLFVDAVQSGRMPAADPFAHAAAAMMGNSVARWHRSYDVRAPARLQTEVVQRLAAWRAGAAQRTAAAGQPPPAAPEQAPASESPSSSGTEAASSHAESAAAWSTPGVTSPESSFQIELSADSCLE